MSEMLLITHSIQCSLCAEHYPAMEYSRLQRRRNKTGKSAVCTGCWALENSMRQKEKSVRKQALYECVVCGKKLSEKTASGGFVLSEKLNKHLQQRSVCSEKCMKLFDMAVTWVRDAKSLTSVSHARNIVVTTWFNRSLAEHEKNIRLQARNAA